MAEQYKTIKLSQADGKHLDVSVCQRCSALVLDQNKHDEDHDHG